MNEAQRRKLATHLAEQTGEEERKLQSEMESKYRTMPGVALVQQEVFSSLSQRARLARKLNSGEASSSTALMSAKDREQALQAYREAQTRRRWQYEL